MIKNAWNQQKQRVHHLANKLEQRQQAEADCREAMKNQSMERFAQVETLFWIGVTGALWFQSRQKTKKEDRHNPLVGVALAGMAARRYQHRTHQAASQVREFAERHSNTTPDDCEVPENSSQ